MDSLRLCVPRRKKSFTCRATNSNPSEQESKESPFLCTVFYEFSAFLPSVLGQTLIIPSAFQVPAETLLLLGGFTQHLLQESTPLRKLLFPSLNWKEFLGFRLESSHCLKTKIPAMCSNRVMSPSLSQ